MLIDFRIIAGCAAIVVGLLVAGANPTRRLNRAFFGFSLIVAAWLLCQWRAAQGGESGLFWVRMACACAVGVVVVMWLVKQAAAEPDVSLTTQVRRMLPWLIIGLALVWICFTPYFIPPTSTDEHRLYGWGYFVYLGAIVAMVIGILVQTSLQMRKLSGARKLELTILLIGSLSAAVAVIALVILGAVTSNSAFNRAQSVFVLAFYVATSWAIVTKRVLDARHLLSIGIAKAAQAVLTTALGWAIYRGAELVTPGLVALFVAVGAGLWFSAFIEPVISRAAGVFRSDAETRRATFEAARRGSRPEQLEQAFAKVLQTWGKAERAIILSGSQGGFAGSEVTLPQESVVLAALRQLRWATPERLARERSTGERRELEKFLREQQLGVLVISEGPSMSAIVGIGVPATHRPFTYPQVTQLMELASIIESALERAHFSVKAQHAEQLATVGLLGASLAHEIRNPLVTIKTFVQLLPKHHQDPAFRAKFFTLIGDEVTRIDRLTEQLLDLASPRAYQAQAIDLHPVLRTSLELVAAKATDKRIQFRTDFQAAPDRTFTDGSAAKQVLLNLCFNAIQAVESREGERWVKVATRNVPGGVEMSVEDSGPGIAPEIRPRLFQPFQSTKSSGFGLGLAICSDILAGLDATIAVDPAEPGHGARFRVVFPCPA